MLKLTIPGQDPMAFRYLVMDYNGTLAIDGELIPGVAPRLRKLRHALDIHIVTADTFGKARSATRDLPCTLAILPPGDQSGAKADYIATLGASLCVCIGNGLNDHLMLARARLGIALVRQRASIS